MRSPQSLSTGPDSIVAPAERARRNPKVGLFFDGTEPGSPVVSVSALAAVRDADIQANAERYVRASKSMVPAISFGCAIRPIGTRFE